MRQLTSILLELGCAGLLLAASACAGPPPGPPIVLRPVAAPRPRVRRPDPCETSGQARLTDAQKASLFQAFDAWQQDRRPAGAEPETPPPPPGPAPKASAQPSRACRVTSP